MRYVVHLAALIGIGAFAVALGDYVSHPSVLGTVGLFVLMVALGVALATLYRPGGLGSAQPAAATPSPADLKAGKGRPSSHKAPSDPTGSELAEPEPAPALWSEAAAPERPPRRPAPSRPSPTADAGWDAREADEARARRRRGRRKR